MKYFNTPDFFAIDLFEGENFRDNLVTLMQQVVAKLKDTISDNYALMKLIIEVCMGVLLIDRFILNFTILYRFWTTLCFHTKQSTQPKASLIQCTKL